MKTVIFEKEKIYFEEVNNDSIVGIQWKYGNRSLIIKTEKGYTGISDDDISKNWLKPSKLELIETAKEIDADFFVFDSHSEAFRWLGEVDSIADIERSRSGM